VAKRARGENATLTIIGSLPKELLHFLVRESVAGLEAIEPSVIITRRATGTSNRNSRSGF
jgi:hypothetical protein